LLENFANKAHGQEVETRRLESMASVRPPAVAGYFYPGDIDPLKAALAKYLDVAVPPDETIPKAIVAPHAGYVYSGAVAGRIYARLKPARDRIRRIVLLGPAHRVAFRGLALSSAQAFASPLGYVNVDRAAVEQVQFLPQMCVLDAAHALEHSLEVHLPFLQQTLGEFSIVPIVTGAVRPAQVREVLTRLWGGAETLIVVSSDLSHYHEYREAQELDRATSQAIENFDVEAIKTEHACGHSAINGLLLTARGKGMSVRTVDQRNSGDTAGARDSVVGYGAYAFV
jgi:AmmeMemoRadiSam system protein B